MGFHRAIVELADSRFLLQVWLALAPVLHAAITVGQEAATGQFSARAREHIVAFDVPIAEAIAAYDADAAIRLLEEQFRDAAEVLRIYYEQRARVTARAPESMTPVFELRKVSKHYGPVRALEEVDFGIWPDEVQAVVGDNGAGKSTLVKIISGAHRHDGGAIFGRLAAPLWGSSCVSLQSAASGGAIGGRQRGSERAPLGLRRCPPRP